MIINRSILTVLDNTGLNKVRCFHLMGTKYGTLGTHIIASAKKMESNTEWSRGDVVRGIIVLVKKEVQRATGVVFKAPVNGVLIISKKWEPLGTRVNSTLPKELRSKGHMKLVAMTNLVI